MITRPLDTIFRSADRMRDASADLLRQMPPGGRLCRSLIGLLAALDQFDADLAIGRRDPAQQDLKTREEAETHGVMSQGQPPRVYSSGMPA
jgi:hypothetical protein